MRYIVDRAIFLQICPRLAFIRYTMPQKPKVRTRSHAYYPGKSPPPMLTYAVAKGHLPSWYSLEVRTSEESPIMTGAFRAGHLTRVEELRITGCNYQPSRLRSLLEAVKVHKETLVELVLEIDKSNDLATRNLMLELLSSPVCSAFCELRIMPADSDESSSAMHFVSEYLTGGGAGGRHFLQELHFEALSNTEDVSSLAGALLLGGNRGPVPNLEIITFKAMKADTIAWLGSRLFARGARAHITSLQFDGTHFEEWSMTTLMDGFRQSGHKGRALGKLTFLHCNVDAGDTFDSVPTHEASLALIAGLQDGLFPTLQELSWRAGALLVQEVPELVEVLNGGAPCARTLTDVDISWRFGPSEETWMNCRLFCLKRRWGSDDVRMAKSLGPSKNERVTRGKGNATRLLSAPPHSLNSAPSFRGTWKESRGD